MGAQTASGPLPERRKRERDKGREKQTDRERDYREYMDGQIQRQGREVRQRE